MIDVNGACSGAADEAVLIWNETNQAFNVGV